MSHKLLVNYRIQIVIRVLLIIVLSFLFFTTYYYTTWFFTPLVIGIIILIVTVNLIAYNERTNRELSTFLISLRQGNFTNKYTSGSKGKTFDQLEKAFEDINLAFQKVNADKESHYQYLKALNDNIGVAIISYLDDGTIQMINPYAKSLINKPVLNSIDDLKSVDEGIYNKILELKTGGTDVVKSVLNDELKYLSVTCRTFITQGETYHLVLIQNIRKALDDKESEAWQKLVRVLTHEIMNSVTPISSLSAAVSQTLHQSNKWDIIGNEDKKDILLSVETIKNRSNGLVNFVKAYKDYARDIDLKKSKVNVELLFNRVQGLFWSNPENRKISIMIDVKPPGLSINVDEGLIEQVLINLVKNAIEEFESAGEGEVTLKSYKYGHKTILEVMDNGAGISSDNIDNIFVPFFTTKRQGTGVGLSLSKKIMQLHSGDIQVKSSHTGTSFSLIFTN